MPSIMWLVPRGANPANRVLDTNRCRRKVPTFSPLRSFTRKDSALWVVDEAVLNGSRMRPSFVNLAELQTPFQF